MSRDLTTTTWRAIARQRTNDVFVLLIDVMLWDADAGEYTCVHVCNNSIDIVSSASGSSVTYIAFPVDVIPPSEESRGASVGTLTISNVTQDIISAIRALTKPMLVTMSIINHMEPDEYVATWPEYIWRQLTYDVNVISGQLSLENFLSEPYPGGTMTSSIFPGLFK